MKVPFASLLLLLHAIINSSCYSRPNRKLTNCFFRAIMHTIVFLFLLSHYIQAYSHRFVQPACVCSGARALYINCKHMFMCLHCMVVQLMRDMFQHKTYTSPNNRPHQSEVESMERGLYLTQTYNCFQVRSLGLVHVIYI